MGFAFRIGPLAALICLAAAGSDSHSLPVKAPAAPAPRTLAIMAWGDAPTDPQQLDWMKEAGFNIAGFCPVTALPAVERAGLTCFVDDARANGYDWRHLPADEELRTKLRALAAEIRPHPGALGVLLRDEPVAAQMAGLGHVAALLRTELAGRLPYVNLFPWTLSPRILGTDYTSYARALADTVGQPYLSYDHYALVDGALLDYFYTNLEVIRRVGLEKGVPFWNCILAVAHNNYMAPTEETLRLQVYATLAYGGRGIEYFRYFTRGLGDYRDGAVDPFGARTPTWGVIQRLNRELAVLAPVLARLKSTGVYHFPGVPEEGSAVAASRLVAEVQTGAEVSLPGFLQTREMLLRRLGRQEPARWLVGEFEDDHGRPYVMLVNKSLTTPFRFRMRLRAAERKLRVVSPFTGAEEPFGGEMDWLAPAAGILMRVE